MSKLSIQLKSLLRRSLRKLLFLWVKTNYLGELPSFPPLKESDGICYILARQSLFDTLVLEEICQRQGLPSPDQKFIVTHNQLLPNCLHLIQQPTIWRIFPPPKPSEQLHQLITFLQRHPEKSIQLIPVTIFWGRSPLKEQSAFKLLFTYDYAVGGRLRKLFAILVHGRQTMINFSTPLTTRELVDEQLSTSRTVRKLARILRVHFRQLRTAVTGPELSHRKTLVNQLLHSQPVKQAILDQANATHDNISRLKSKAHKYANEIVSDFRYPAVRFLDIILTWFWNKLYNGIQVNHVEPIQQLAKDHEIIYVPCHRSHIDYLLLSYVLYKQNLSPPHIAAGINLNMPLIGGLLRRGGAFFMRRSFKGNKLYTTVFNEYLHTLLTRGFPTEYFIEGGRSRTGRLLQPKTGMLALTLQSYLKDQRKPFCFVPVYIGYERVLEGNTYLGELRGKAKKTESPLDILRILSALKKEFGKVWVNFGEPILLNQFLDQKEPHWQSNIASESSSYTRQPWFRDLTQQLANTINYHINAAAVANPVNLIATALLSAPKQAMSEESLKEQVTFYRWLLEKLPYSERIISTPKTATEAILYVEKLGFIRRQTDSLGDVIYVEGKHAVLMTYYRNNTLHLFAIPSLISCFFNNSSRIKEADLLPMCNKIYPYLRTELFLPWQPDHFRSLLKQWLDILVDHSILQRENGWLHSPNPESVTSVTFNFLGKTIIQTLERFYMALSLLIRSGSGQINRDTLEKQCHELAQRLSFIQGINAPEFFDKSLFKNFIESLRQQDLVQADEQKNLSFTHNIHVILNSARYVLPNEARQAIQQLATEHLSKQ
ncbi:glycerol-3-phosphate 1-O-acyltransferase PlsB [Zooshikella harenae]|uniref:Glycerol-3-phosphate acyltransferase n=1 Tax=Zooshikella harenae TaxID=2827238 RepID=A0ABS5Z8U0_9GAMM|nr:glycerol-3-phosphate 1-O-acyltransferase PlsB [Zooshikella harenae]MBU2709725.1 glycerol-3-phosphate 1-O-acyltransferase PlsB [Zooshikella harenae]